MKTDINEFLKKYLNIDQILISNNKGLDIVNKTDTTEKYFDSLARLYDILSRSYLKNGIMLYMFNDYLLTFDYAFNEIKSLYDYAEKNNVENGCEFLGDFLLSYQFSIESEPYKNSKIYAKLIELFYLSFPKKEFYGHGKFVNDSLNYMTDLIQSSQIEFDINFYFDNIDKLVNRAKMDERYGFLFNTLLEKKTFFSKLFDYDYNYNDHIVQYNDYIVNNAGEFKWNQYKFESALSLLVKLYNKNILYEKSYKEILNKLILEINEVIDGYNGRMDNTVSFISNIDQILSALNKIKKCHEYYKLYENKIECCIRLILFCKRSYMKNEEIDSKMAVVEHEFKIEKQKMDDIEKGLLKSYQNIFSYLKVDFDEMLESAIKSHSDHPLVDLFSHVSINTDQGTYFKWQENQSSSFSEYYNEKGKDIIKSFGSKLINIYRGDYYYLMIRHMSMTFTMAGQLIALWFKDLLDTSFREYICTKIIGVKGEAYKKDYVLCVHLILCIEKLIYEQIHNIGLDYNEKSMFSNLENLFNYYRKDKLSRDIYMFVNYTLYDDFGMKYRNNFMHGNIVHKNDLTIELLYIFSCVIGLLLVGNENENRKD